MSEPRIRFRLVIEDRVTIDDIVTTADSEPLAEKHYGAAMDARKAGYDVVCLITDPDGVLPAMALSLDEDGDWIMATAGVMPPPAWGRRN